MDKKDKIEATNRRIADEMERLMCSRCALFHNGCTPGHIIICTPYFLEVTGLKKPEVKKDGKA